VIPIVLISSGWKRPLREGFLFYGVVNRECTKGRVKRSYPKVSNFSKQLFVVFVDHKIRVIFDDWADICGRRSCKRDGPAKARRAA